MSPQDGAQGAPAPKKGRRASSKRKPVNLALQGGGAHGAFTWGVLDRLIEDEDLEFEGVTATSAGAMNGAMLTTGLKVGGREEAKRRLRTFWERIRDSHPFNQPPWSYWSSALAPLGSTFEPYALDSHPAFVVGDMVSRLVSPYQFNPAGVNPLREILESLIDFSVVCRTDNPRLFVCATDVSLGRAKIFKGEEISVDALLASACLPFLYQAVEIEGRAYWDGGYTGNPPIWPLFYDCASEDVILVEINPIEREEVPRDARAIQNRVNEISFNSNLMAEMRAIQTMNRLIDAGAIAPGEYKRMRVHMIEDFDTMRRLSVSTKLNPNGRMLEELFEAGRASAENFLAEHKDSIGVKSSLDLRDTFL